MNKKIVYGAITITFIVAVLALVVSVGSKPSAQLGAITSNLASLGLADLSVGSACGDAYTTCNATDISHIIATTCNLLSADVSQGASTTKAYSCAVTNLTSSDKVIAQLATSTYSVGQDWIITGAKASTTAGFAVVLLRNNGVAAAPAATSISSSTVIFAFQ